MHKSLNHVEQQTIYNISEMVKLCNFMIIKILQLVRHSLIL